MTPKTVLAMITVFAAVALMGCGDDGSSSSIIMPPDDPVDSVPPAAPSGVLLSTTPANVVLSWTANSEADLAGYLLERSLDEGATWQALSATVLTTTTYTDYKNRSAQYRVAATDQSDNQSAYSSQVGYWLETGDPKLPSMPITPQR